MPVSTDYIFTLNNYTDEECNTIKSWKDKVVYLSVGKEIGSSGTPHLQGCVRWSAKTTFSTLKTYLTRAHWEVMKKPLAANIRYTQKDANVLVLIDNRLGLKRPKTDRNEDVHKRLKSGETVSSIIDDYPSLIYSRKTLEYHQLKMLETVRTEPPEVIYVTGPPGSGKTRYVYETEQNNVDFLQVQGGRFVSGYTFKDAVCFDDIRRCDLPHNVLLKLLDRYPTQIEVKGGSVQWNPKRIYLTCYRSVDEEFGHRYVNGVQVPEDIRQLKRRITKYINVDALSK